MGGTERNRSKRQSRRHRPWLVTDLADPDAGIDQQPPVGRLRRTVGRRGRQQPSVIVHALSHMILERTAPVSRADKLEQIPEPLRPQRWPVSAFRRWFPAPSPPPFRRLG